MSIFLQVLAFVGWRGAAGALVGAVISSFAAYAAGQWVERQVGAERLQRRLSDYTRQQMELENARIEAALAARRRANRDGFGADLGGLPDDGFRRD